MKKTPKKKKKKKKGKKNNIEIDKNMHAHLRSTKHTSGRGKDMPPFKTSEIDSTVEKKFKITKNSLM